MEILVLPYGGGDNPYQDLLASHLEERGHQVAMVDPPRVLPLLRTVLAVDRPDLIHLHWTHRFIVSDRAWIGRVLSVQFLVELTLLKLAGYPIVWTVHNLVDHDLGDDAWEIAVNRRAVRRYDALITHCPAARDDVQDTLRPEENDRIHVVPHGNYVGVYADDIDTRTARRRLDLPEDATVLLFFGHIRPYKGIEELIETVEGDDDPDLHLVIAGSVGSEELAARVRQAARDDDRISTVLKYVPDDEVQILMRAADAVVLPFRDVLSSGSVLLAASFDRAVLAPRIGCVGDFLDEPQPELLYDPDDPDGLRRVLANLDEIDLEAAGEANLRRARARSWDRVAEATQAVYEEARGA